MPREGEAWLPQDKTHQPDNIVKLKVIPTNIQSYSSYSDHVFFHRYYVYKHISLVVGFNPSEKYEFVIWDDEIPNLWKNQSHVPNHQPVHIESIFEKVSKPIGKVSCIFDNLSETSRTFFKRLSAPSAPQPCIDMKASCLYLSNHHRIDCGLIWGWTS